MSRGNVKIGSSHPRSSTVRVLVGAAKGLAIGCIAIVVTALACNGDNGGAYAGDDTVIPQQDGATVCEACACSSEGEQVACGEVVERSPTGVITCGQGVRACVQGKWSTCSLHTYTQVASSGKSPLALGSPNTCGNNPCDPYCWTVHDTPSPGVCSEAGLRYTDAGEGGCFIEGSTSASSETGVVPPDICTTDNDCDYDRCCAAGACKPFSSSLCGDGGDGGNYRSGCVYNPPVGVFAPKLTCNYIPSGTDGNLSYIDVQASPVVADFGLLDATFGKMPSLIVANFSDASPGDGLYPNDTILRLINAKTCSQVTSCDLAGKSIISTTHSLLVDLDGDSKPEIVAVGWDKSGTCRSYGDYSTCSIPGQGTPGVWRLMSFKIAQNCATPPCPPNALSPVTCSLIKESTDTDGVTAWGFSYSGQDWGGPGAADLNGDGQPEIMWNGYTFDRNLKRIGAQPPGFMSGSFRHPGTFPTLLDFNADGKIDQTDGEQLWSGSIVAGTVTWTLFAGMGNLATGFVPQLSAAGDFGNFGVGIPSGTPEIVGRGQGASEGEVVVRALDGSVVMRLTVPPGGLTDGGPPTVADFDGDGLPEIGIASKRYYTVFDPDCLVPKPAGRIGYLGKTGTCATTPPCDCVAAGDCDAAVAGRNCPAGLLWSRKTQDLTSGDTSSTVFDFDGDGKAEVVYADECFTRVYAGTDGTTLFSTFHNSITWTEGPIVADVDDDSHANIIIPENTSGNRAPAYNNYGMSCTLQITTMNDVGAVTRNVDNTFGGQRCNPASAGLDCKSGSCDAATSQCLCTTNDQCCAAGAGLCPSQGSACIPTGAKKFCRSIIPPLPPVAGAPPYPAGTIPSRGIKVYSDAFSRWRAARAVWNQNAYFPGVINDNGSIPTTAALSLSSKNWFTAGTTTLGGNSFRAQTWGSNNPSAAPDITVQLNPIVACTGSACPMATPNQVTATVCNRGAAALSAGATVDIYNNTSACGVSTAGITPACSTTTSKVLNPGECQSVQCCIAGPLAAMGSAKGDIINKVAECNEANNCGELTWGCAMTATIPQATFTRTYDVTGVCPAGTRVKWGRLAYATFTPADSSFKFEVKSADTVGGLASATACLSANVPAAPNVVYTTAAPVGPDVGAQLIACGVLPTYNTLMVVATMMPSTGTPPQSPVLNGWDVTFDCLPAL